MDAASLLTDRRHILYERLEQVARAVAPDGAAEHWIDKELQNAVCDRQRQLRQDGELPIDGEAWQIFATREEACRGLFREALAFLSVQAKRPPAVDLTTGPRLLAVALVEELSKVCGSGIQPSVALDADESFSDFVQVVRLRFPVGEIWDLPVTAHEFGHFAAYRLTASVEGLQRTLPFKDCVQDMLSEKDLDDVFGSDAFGRPREEQKRYHLNEYFADMFATYVMGPSFALTSLLLRFDVAAAFVRTDWGHPSYAMRAAAILATLELMNEEPPTEGAFDDLISFLRKLWLELLTSASGAAAQRIDEAADLTGKIVPRLYDVLGSVAQNARYTSWQLIREELQYAVGPSTGERAQRYQLRDLLNAAWVVRTQGRLETAVISRSVLKLFGA